jgi:hypothetical protein
LDGVTGYCLESVFGTILEPSLESADDVDGEEADVCAIF